MGLLRFQRSSDSDSALLARSETGDIDNEENEDAVAAFPQAIALDPRSVEPCQRRSKAYRAIGARGWRRKIYSRKRLRLIPRQWTPISFLW